MHIKPRFYEVPQEDSVNEIVIRDDVPFPEKTQKRKGKPSSPHTRAMEKLKLGQSFETGPFSQEEAKKQSILLSNAAANTNRRKYFNPQWRLRISKRFDIDTEEYFVGVWCVHKDSFKNIKNSKRKK